MKKRVIISVIYYLALLILFVVAARAASVTLAWDANTEPDLSDYIIYHGTAPGEYTKTYVLSEHKEMWSPACGPVYDPFKKECCEITVSELVEGNNYFVATAKDEDDNESAYSDELVHFVNKINRHLLQPKDFEKLP